MSQNPPLPNPKLLAKYSQAPQQGPRVLFFSGGTALNPLCRELINYTHNSIHLITPFDSGGSSAVLRRTFDILAVGDTRNRLAALADGSQLGYTEMTRFLTHRLAKDGEIAALHHDLGEIAGGRAELVKAIPPAQQELVLELLRRLLQEMPRDFDLRGASLGNLLLAGGVLGHRGAIAPVLFLLGRLIGARGEARPVVIDALHLGARLADGSTVLGQHRLTGKECPPLSQPITELFLNQGLDRKAPARANLEDKGKKLIAGADLIVFPMGSFYTSLIATLLPTGVGRAIAANPCPKLFIPNSGPDPELVGMDLTREVLVLIKYLQQDCLGKRPVKDLLNHILIDTANGEYPGPIAPAEIEKLGIQLLDLPLATTVSKPLYADKRLAEIIVSLASTPPD